VVLDWEKGGAAGQASEAMPAAMPRKEILRAPRIFLR
jgi:hypothetical protein